MEAIAAIASTITTLIFSEALKEGGKTLGKSASDKFAQLIATIRQRFKESGTEVLLTRAEKQPTEYKIAIVEAELVTQMSDDENFARKLEELVKQLEHSDIIRQVMLSDIQASNLEVKGDMTQRASKDASVEQVMGAGLEIGGDVKFGGNLTQES